MSIKINYVEEKDIVVKTKVSDIKVGTVFTCDGLDSTKAGVETGLFLKCFGNFVVSLVDPSQTWSHAGDLELEDVVEYDIEIIASVKENNSKIEEKKLSREEQLEERINRYHSILDRNCNCNDCYVKSFYKDDGEFVLGA